MLGGLWRYMKAICVCTEGGILNRPLRSVVTTAGGSPSEPTPRVPNNPPETARLVTLAPCTGAPVVASTTFPTAPGA